MLAVLLFVFSRSQHHAGCVIVVIVVFAAVVVRGFVTALTHARMHAHDCDRKRKGTRKARGAEY